MKSNLVKTVVLCVCSALFILTVPAAAQEMQKAYTDAELAKVEGKYCESIGDGSESIGKYWGRF